MRHQANDGDAKSNDLAAWIALAFLAAAVTALQLHRPLAIELGGLTKLALASAALACAGSFYGLIRKRDNFAVMCWSLMQVLLFSCVGSILSYLLAREGGTFWDSTFARWDRALGFDWLAYVRWVDAQPTVATILRLAYASLIPQMIAVVLVLGFTGRINELRATMLAAIVSGTVTVLMSPLFPAVSNFVWLGLVASDFQHVSPWAGYSHLADLTALRDGSLAMVRIPEMQGIITFPSYHAALATVTCWGFWRSGNLCVRALGCTVAVATIIATPVDGGHYLVDVLAGIAIAIASIAASNRWIYWRLPRGRLTAWPSRRLRAASAQ